MPDIACSVGRSTAAAPSVKFNPARKRRTFS
jgi:hypothetical protein